MEEKELPHFDADEIDLEEVELYRKNVPEEQRIAAMHRMQGYPELGGFTYDNES